MRRRWVLLAYGKEPETRRRWVLLAHGREPGSWRRWVLLADKRGSGMRRKWVLPTIVALAVAALAVVALQATGVGMALLARGGVARTATGIATPIHHVVVIFQENVSFDHYFGTYPHALNPPGEPPFVARPGTPRVNGLSHALLTDNPNLANPQRLDRADEPVCDQDHEYDPEQLARDSGKLDRFVQETGRGNAYGVTGPDCTTPLPDHASAYQSAVLGDGPVGYWRLGESRATTAADSSTGGNTGVIHGRVTLGVPGPLAHHPDTAMSFDGATAYVGVADTPNLDIRGDLTLEAWVKPAALDGATHTIVHKGGAYCDSTQPYQYRLMLYRTNQWRGVVCVGGNAYDVLDSKDRPSTTSWTYLALTRRGSTLALYVNGRLAAPMRTDASGALNTSTSDLGIGRLGAGEDYVKGGSSRDYFKGAIADVAVYDKALTATQIQDHYKAGIGAMSALTDAGTLVAGDQTTNKLVMDYYDGNTVTALWNYAQHFTLLDNSFGTTFGSSTPGAINLISGDTSHVTIPRGSTAVDLPFGAWPITGQDVVRAGVLIGSPDGAFDDCSSRMMVRMTGTNIGDLLNARGVTWGWFQGGFRPSGRTAGGKAICGSRHRNIAGAAIQDYVPHQEPFEYYASTANPHHLPPTSVAMIGHHDRANHQYDLADFDAALAAGNLPAVSFLKAPAYQQGHPGYSDPLDEQEFLVSTINRIERSPEWASTAIIIAYDDSDGWYDHVAGPIVNPSSDVPPDHCGTTRSGQPPDRCGYGPRLPMLIISPFAKSNYVDHDLTDQTSILRFIEDNWHLGRIGGVSFDRLAGSLANAFAFRRPANPPLVLDPRTGCTAAAKRSCAASASWMPAQLLHRPPSRATTPLNRALAPGNVANGKAVTSAAAATVPAGPNLLQDPSFEDGLGPWALYVRSDAAGTARATVSRDRTTAQQGTYAAKVAVSQAGPQTYYVALDQGNLALTGRQTYRVTFWAKADAPHQVKAETQQNYAPWRRYHSQLFNLTTSWQPYTMTFTQGAADANVELLFNVGQQTGDVWIDNVSLTPATP